MEVPVWIFWAVSGVIALWGFFGVSLMANGRKWLKAKIKNELLEKLALLVYDTVAALGPVVRAAKDAAADGKLTKKEIDDLEDMAWAIVKRGMGIGELVELYGSEEAARDAVNTKVKSTVELQKALAKK